MKALAAAVFLVLVSPAAAVPPAVPFASLQEADPFEGAWSPEALEQAAEPIIEAWRKGGPQAGDGALEVALARADGAPERARILTAYGVYLMVENTSEDLTIGSTLALPYMQRALDEGRSGFPADSRMLAVLLHDAATTEFMARARTRRRRPRHGSKRPTASAGIGSARATRKRFRHWSSWRKSAGSRSAWRTIPPASTPFPACTSAY